MERCNELLTQETTDVAGQNEQRCSELLTQESTEVTGQNEHKKALGVVTPEKMSQKTKELETTEKANEGSNGTPGENTKAKRGKAVASNPYATLQCKKRNVVIHSEDAKQAAGKKLKFEAFQTTGTVFCKMCMTEHKKKNVDRFYKCNSVDCGRLIKDEFRDEDEMLPGTDLNEDVYDNLEKQFHAIQFAFVYDNGPNKENTRGLFKMREKAISAGILPKDHYVDKYGKNHTMTSAVRAVANSLEKRDSNQFRYAFHALMYLVIFGNYCKFERPITR